MERRRKAGWIMLVAGLTLVFYGTGWMYSALEPIRHLMPWMVGLGLVLLIAAHFLLKPQKPRG